MKTEFSCWLRYLHIGILICFVWTITGCADVEQKHRVQNYFGLAADEQLNSTNIQTALLQQFPLGTLKVDVETALVKRGFGKDGHSEMWQTNGVLYCVPDDFEDSWFKLGMRRIDAGFYFDDQEKLKKIDVETYVYSL
jgi:hypothetical protein